jgi:hypothetical protein
MTDGKEQPKATVRKSVWTQVQADSEASDRVTKAILKELLPYMPHLYLTSKCVCG